MKIAIILAAGEGTRMKSSRHKTMMDLNGKPMIRYVLDAVDGCVEKKIVVVGNKAEDLVSTYKNEGVDFAYQPIGEGNPYGTGFAVMQATPQVKDDDTVLVICGDTPLIRNESIKNFFKFFDDIKAEACVMSTVVPDSYGYGRIVREDGKFKEIVEEKDADDLQRNIKEVNSGIFLFKAEKLKYALEKIDTNNAQGELYITDCLSILRRENFKVDSYTISDYEEILGVNDRVQLSYCASVIRKRINEAHMRNGVSLVDPLRTYIDSNSVIESDVTIYPDTYIVSSKISKGTVIYESCRIEDSEIGENCVIRQSYIEKSTVESGVTMGPYAHLRPHCRIMKDAHIGNFVEMKNSQFGEKSKAGHLAYVGDATVGREVNIGCGAVFVNYDGKNKHRTNVGDHAFIGSNANLVAPVNVGNFGFVAAGSTITADVQEDALAIERADQKIIPDWVSKRGMK